MTRIAKPLGTIAFVAVTLSSVLIALVSYRFVPQGVAVAMEHMAHFLNGNALALYAHIGIAPVALAVMPFQFFGRLRTRRKAIHRLLGRIYVGAILISGTAGLWLALHSQAGVVAATGFGLLAVAWLATTALAFRFALSREIALHRRWMIRSAALTFAAVTLRLYLGVSLALGADFAVVYSVIAWACWLPNAVVAELFLRWPNATLSNPARGEPLTGQS